MVFDKYQEESLDIETVFPVPKRLFIMPSQPPPSEIKQNLSKSKKNIFMLKTILMKK